MKLIEATEIMHIAFLKKETFAGSSEGMRYRFSKVVYHDPDTGLLKKIEAGEADYPVDKKTGEKILNPTIERNTLGVWVWPEPFSFEKTPEEQKKYKEFEFSEEGLNEAINWLGSEE